MNKQEKYLNKKYRILEILNTKFSLEDARKLRNKTIPNALCISERTFNNWIYAKKESGLEISYRNLYKIAKILDTSIEALFNFDIEFELITPKK